MKRKANAPSNAGRKPFAASPGGEGIRPVIQLLGKFGDWDEGHELAPSNFQLNVDELE